MSDYKRKKNYFSNSGNHQKKHKQFILEIGMKGFLCTCNFREKDCIKDAYKLLSEFSEKLRKSDNDKDSDLQSKVELVDSTDKVPENPQKSDDEEDISAALSKEIHALKAECNKPVAETVFQAVETGVKNVVFIRSWLGEPLELAYSIIEEIYNTKKQKTRFILRLLPIELVCKAYMDDIRSKADPLLDKYFTKEPKTFCIVFNRHSNNNIKRTDVIEDLAEIISKKNPGNKADLKNPEIAVVVEVIRGVCLISIAPNYFKYKKYNLIELGNSGKSQEEKDKAKEDNSGEGEFTRDTELKEDTK